MTNEIRSPNDESRRHAEGAVSSFEFRHYFGLRHWSFGFENSSLFDSNGRPADWRPRQHFLDGYLRAPRRILIAWLSRPQQAPIELGLWIIAMPIDCPRCCARGRAQSAVRLWTVAVLGRSGVGGRECG